MKRDLIIIRYGEIGLKAKETRRRFEISLVNNIKNAINLNKISCKIKTERGRIFVFTDQINKTSSILQKIFGITSISPAIKTISEMKLMSELSIKILNQKLSNKTSFALRVFRTGNHDYTSQDVAVSIGNDIVKDTKSSVNLTNPDCELFIEIRNDIAYFFTEKISGTGGLPLGTQGKVIVLIDTPKSILAAWYIMRRGCKPIFLKIQNNEIDNISAFASDWYIKPKIFSLNPKSNNFYKDINKLAIKNDCDAFVTGHTLLNRTNKNISEIKSLKKHIKLPILYPLIAMDTQEIENKCKEIGIPL